MRGLTTHWLTIVCALLAVDCSSSKDTTPESKPSGQQQDSSATAGSSASTRDDIEESKSTESQATSGSAGAGGARAQGETRSAGTATGGAQAKSESGTSKSMAGAASPGAAPDMKKEQSKSSDGCEAGQKQAANGKCVCDLTGTFAIRERFKANLAGLPGTEELNDDLDYWVLAHTVQQEAGKLTITLEPCSEAVPEMCGTGLPPLLPGSEAYGQYVSAWNKAKAPDSSYSMSLPMATPDQEFVTPPLAQLVGISLSDPLGDFPHKTADIDGADEFDGSAVNGAHWLDPDGDGVPGFASVSIPPGGAKSDPEHGPYQDFGAMSMVCPRKDGKAQRSAYAYMPVSDVGGLRRLKGYSTAQRVILELHGKLESCNRVTGDVTGASGKELKMENVFHSCTLAEDGGAGSPCGKATVEMLQTGSDMGFTTNISKGGTFAMVRVQEGTSCRDVRGMSFDP